jgi:hypothetical protein
MSPGKADPASGLEMTLLVRRHFGRLPGFDNVIGLIEQFPAPVAFFLRFLVSFSLGY